MTEESQTLVNGARDLLTLIEVKLGRTEEVAKMQEHIADCKTLDEELVKSVVEIISARCEELLLTIKP